MTSIAEKYAARWMPNGEVSLVELIEAALREQAVPYVAITDAGKIMQLVWAYGDSMYQHGRGRNDNDECPHYSEAQDVLAMFEPLLTNPTSISAAELEALRKDAERYRWLRDDAFEHSDDCFMEAGRLFAEKHGVAFDYAIDAAIAQGKGE